jgi:hypothetical protein
MVLVAAFLPDRGVFSHKLARPIVYHAQGQWTHENATIYGSISSFRVRRMQSQDENQAPAFRVFMLPQGNYLAGYEHENWLCADPGRLKIVVKKADRTLFCVEGKPVKEKNTGRNGQPAPGQGGYFRRPCLAKISTHIILRK